jgi:hypothetical protein
MMIGANLHQEMLPGKTSCVMSEARAHRWRPGRSMAPHPSGFLAVGNAAVAV